MDYFIPFFILFGIMCSFNCLIETNSSVTDYRNLRLFLNLLKMQNENCGTGQVCAVENETRGTDITFDQTGRSCCLKCFCSRHCKNKETCCPDFQIHDGIESDRHGNISKITDERFISFSSAEVDGNGVMKTCISSRLINRNIMYGLNGIRESYLAVSRCPVAYANDVIKSRCEEVNVEDSTMIDDHIPVTSISTKFTYRNIFCLQCNEDLGTDYILWRTYLTCSRQFVIQNYIEPPLNLYRNIVSKSIPYCNIIFMPPIEVQPYVENCFQTDVHSCIKTHRERSNVTSDYSDVTSVYEEICRRYLLPVITVNKQYFTVYKNIACYLCNNNERLPDTCYISYPDYGEYNLEININNTIKSSDYVQKQYDDKCDVGYIQDEKMELCRKILCPRHFYLHNGTCIPTISRVEGVFFNLIIEIIPKSDIPVSIQLLKQYESQLESMMSEEVTIVFELLQIDMWRKTSKLDKFVANIVSVSFKSSQYTYSEMIEKSRIMLSKIEDRKLKVNSTVITIGAELSDNNYEVKRLHKAIERESRSILKPVRVSTTLKVNDKRFILSRGHFCDRMELISTEFTLLGKNTFKILNTGVRVEGEYFDVTEERKFLACIEDIIVVKDRDKNKIPKSVVTEDDDITVIFIFGIFVCLVVLIIMGRVITLCCRKY